VTTPRSGPERDWREMMWSCERWLGKRAPQSAAAILRDAADALAHDAWPDRYGDGGVVEEFEGWMTSMLGTEAVAVFPSGTMAQQIALRIHCRRRGLETVAHHPTCHLELHEHGGHAHLHGLKAELVGQRDRLLTREDLEGVRARDRGAAVHLDGARIWESAPYYGRSHAEIAGLRSRPRWRRASAGLSWTSARPRSPCQRPRRHSCSPP